MIEPDPVAPKVRYRIPDALFAAQKFVPSVVYALRLAPPATVSDALTAYEVEVSSTPVLS